MHLIEVLHHDIGFLIHFEPLASKFVTTKRNNTPNKTYILMKSIYALLIITLTVFTSCTAPSISEDEVLFEDNATVSLDAVSVEVELLELFNAHRSQVGLSSLEISEEAYAFAVDHNDHMIAKGKISHDNFNERASNLAEVTGAINIKENVAKSYTSAEKALNGWLNSASHRKTIEGDFTHTSISVKADENGKLYYTQLFLKK